MSIWSIYFKADSLKLACFGFFMTRNSVLLMGFINRTFLFELHRWSALTHTNPIARLSAPPVAVKVYCLFWNMQRTCGQLELRCVVSSSGLVKLTSEHIFWVTQSSLIRVVLPNPCSVLDTCYQRQFCLPCEKESVINCSKCALAVYF